MIGPTGVGLRNGTLYVADTIGDRITAIPHALTRHHSAGTGPVVSSGGHLNGPLGLAIAPGGDILTVDGGDGDVVETSARGDQVAARQSDASGARRVRVLRSDRPWARAGTRCTASTTRPTSPTC